MSTALYRGFVRVFEKWPCDPSKSGRDLSEYLRRCVASGFRNGEQSSVDRVHCQKQLDSIYRLTSNHHLLANPRNGNGSATGMTPEQCHHVMSNETLAKLDELDQTVLGRIKLSLPGWK